MGAAVVTIGWYCSGKWHKSQPFVQQTTITHIRVSENQKLFFTFAFLGGVHIEVFIYIHLVRENLWWENTNRTFWMSSKNNWYYPQFKTSFMCQRSLTLFHVFFMYNKLFYCVFSFKKRSSTPITLYHTAEIRNFILSWNLIISFWYLHNSLIAEAMIWKSNMINNIIYFLSA